TVLFILDGDVAPSEIEFENILVLPGETSPEMVFYNYLFDLTKNLEHEIWNNPTAKNNGFNIRHFLQSGPDCYEGKSREQNKKWFNDYLPLFESLRLFEYWALDNNDVVDRFEKDFKEKFNKVAKISSIPKIII
ncbi:MAG: hypothetical protein SCK28_04605, partial [Bacillota bacterium]|nr:hypothetical protein [Bacillota bacterium]